MTSKKVVLDTISDLITNFLYYNRKEDEDLPVGSIESMVIDGEITIEEILQAFEKELREALGIKS